MDFQQKIEAVLTVLSFHYNWIYLMGVGRIFSRGGSRDFF